MKKMSLSNRAKFLTRSEMRIIAGGYTPGLCNTRRECPEGCAVFTGDGHGYCSTCCIA